MTMKVYVDTSALLALIGVSDTHHAAVTKAVEQLVADGATFVTCSYVLVESGALVKHRLGAAAFQALGDTVERGIDVVWVDAALHREAWNTAARAARGGPSLVDCTSFQVMRQLKIDTALAIDTHFRQAGFTVVP